MTHYDAYANLPSWKSGNAFVNEDGIATQNNFLNGQVIASQVRVLGTSNFNKTVTYFDDRYRTTQTTGDNAAGGKDRITKILSFDGKPTSDYHSHTSRFYTTALVIQQTYAYDHVDRLLSVTHKTAAQEVVTVSQNTYNEIGQLLNKKLHQSPSHPNALQKLDYYSVSVYEAEEGKHPVSVYPSVTPVLTVSNFAEEAITAERITSSVRVSVIWPVITGRFSASYLVNRKLCPVLKLPSCVSTSRSHWS
jgi:hypothetical protein